tara:strand:- start:2556 stop:5141 length:2586 start_codon:yes stop_codon:yes gene_type:complete
MGTPEDEESHNKRIARLVREEAQQRSLAAAVDGTVEAEKALLRAAEAAYALAVQRGVGQAAALRDLETQRRLTEAATEAFIDYDKAGKDLAKTMGGLVGLSGNFEQSMVGQAAATLTSTEGMANFKGQLKETFHPLNVGMGLITAVGQATYALAIATDTALVSFNKQTGAAERYGAEIRGLNTDMYTHNVNVAAAAEAYGHMAKNITDLPILTHAARKEFSDTVSVLEQLGVSGGTTTANIQFMTKSLGIGATESAQYQRELFSLATEIGMPPAEMAEQFKAAGPKMAEFGKEAGKVFKDLAVNARKAGMEVSDLLAFVDKFDTFAGAAGSVGQLNALLGGPFLNSMDLVMETDPSKRMAMISDALRDAGKSFDDMTYYERKAIAAAGGFKDVEELAKVMAGEFDNAAGGAHKTEAEMEALKEQQKEFNTLAEETAQFLRAFALDMYPVLQTIKWIMAAIQKVIAGTNKWIESLTGVQNAVGYWILALGTAAFALGLYRRRIAQAAAAELTKALNTAILTTAENTNSAATSLSTIAKGVQTGATVGQTTATATLAAVQTTVAIPAQQRSTRSILGFVVAIGALLVGLGIAAWGIGQLASAFQSMNAEQITAAKWALIGFGIGIIALIGALALIQGGPQAALVWGAVGILLAIGAAAMMLGKGIEMASKGLGTLGPEFATLLATFAKHWVIALKMPGWFRDLGWSMRSFGNLSKDLGPSLKNLQEAMNGMVEVNNSLAVVNESVISLSFVNSENLENVATAIGKIVGHINNVKVNKAAALANALNASDAGSRISKAGGSVATREAGSAAAQDQKGARAAPVPLHPVTVNLTIDKRVFDAMVIHTTREEFARLQRGKGPKAKP